MKTLLVSDDVHKRWKVFCSRKDIKMQEATDIALQSIMGVKKKK